MSVATDQTAANVERYRYVPVERPWLMRGERIALESLLRPGMDVLDVGCGSGRVTRWMLERGARVTACDLSEPALSALRMTTAGDLVEIVRADARELLFEDDRFDLVVFAWNGIDWIDVEAERNQALRELARVAKPGGHVLFSSHNPVGTLFTWRSPGSLKIWRWRLRYARTGDFRGRTFHNPDGLLLFHEAPRSVVRRAEREAGLEPVFVLGCTGLSRSVPLLTVFSAWPYYAFRKGDA